MLHLCWIYAKYLKYDSAQIIDYAISWTSNKLALVGKNQQRRCHKTNWHKTLLSLTYTLDLNPRAPRAYKP